MNNPTKQSEQSPELSIVVPAYNEEQRILPTLQSMVEFFDARAADYEILIVDDGSSDRTVETVRNFQSLHPQVQLIQLPENKGKGNAVRTGMRQAKGQYLLFADADGATPIAEIDRLETALRAGADLGIGSRALFAEDTRVTTSAWRKYPGRVFNFCVNSILLPGIADTQCGFKLFTADAARFLFHLQTSERYSFDVELLYLARKAGMSIAEVPVNWTNIPGSKVNVVRDGLRMLADVFKFALRHRKVNEISFKRSRKLNNSFDNP